MSPHAHRDPDILRALALEYLRAGRRPPPECTPILNEVEESPMPTEDPAQDPPPAAPGKTPCACGRPARVKGRCGACYTRARRAGKGKASAGPTAPAAPPSKAPKDLGAALDRLRAAHPEALTALEGAGLPREGARAVVERLVAAG